MTAAFVAALLSVIAAGLSWLGYQSWRSSHPSWKPLPGRPGWWASQDKVCPVPPERIAEALTQAEGCLMRFSTLSVAAICSAGSQAQIMIRNADAWVDSWKRTVAGAQIGTALAVGPSLAALCHELAHLAETQNGGTTDESHASWYANGVFKAVDAYNVWLKENPR